MAYARRVQPAGYPRAQCRYIDQDVRRRSTTGAIRRPARPAASDRVPHPGLCPGAGRGSRRRPSPRHRTSRLRSPPTAGQHARPGRVISSGYGYRVGPGSPPRARGRLSVWVWRLDRRGLTPACAGTSRTVRISPALSRAHPRVRGDIVGARLRPRVDRGSPPRARGHPPATNHTPRRRGLTPACAGTSSPTTSAIIGGRAHPRVRGDIDWPAVIAASLMGSPPRARGHLDPQVGDRVQCGLTPACAGTSWSASPAAGETRAHPRVRGDIRTVSDGSSAGWGSPPRARGHRAAGPVRGAAQGLTPACAGTSRCVMVANTHASGSPPRARGHPGGDQRRGGRRGLTPACAGTSARQRTCGSSGRAHPRVRGDINPTSTAYGLFQGSPPRARGHPLERTSQTEQWGLTPACAGTSRRRGWWPSSPRAHPRVRGDITLTIAAGIGTMGSPPRARGHPSAPKR